MARKIICPHCNAETYNTPRCGRCGNSLQQTTNDAPETAEQKDKRIVGELLFKDGIVERADQSDKNLHNVLLAQFKAIRTDDEAGLMNSKLVVKKDRRQYVYTSMDAKPISVSEGRYDLGKIIVAGKGRSRTAGSLICEVSDAPMPVTFCFPDKEALGEGLEQQRKSAKPNWEYVVSQIDEALASHNMRTSDGVIGGATLQLRLRCVAPLKLTRLFSAGGTSLTDDNKSKSGAANRSPVHDEFRPFAERQPDENDKDYDTWWEKLTDLDGWKDWFMGKRPEKVTLEANRITMHDLYSFIRLELADAIANSIRDFKAEALYGKEDTNRERLHSNIRDYMNKTLADYGLQIENVVSFQFRSPKYEKFLQERGDLSMQRQSFEEIERDATELRGQQRELGHAEFKHVEKFEEEKDMLSLDRRGRVQERQDQLAADETRRLDELNADQQTRWLAMDAKRLEFERQQQAAEDDRQHQQAMRALDLHERLQAQQTNALLKLQDAEHKRRIEAVNLIAGKKPEEQLILAMQFNPELQQSFIAMQHAKSNEDKVAMAQQFQGQVQQIYGDQSDQSNALLIEAAKALGLAVGARVQDRAPPLQIKVEHVSGRGSAE